METEGKHTKHFKGCSSLFKNHMAISNIKITYYEANNTCSDKTNDSAHSQADRRVEERL